MKSMNRFGLLLALIPFAAFGCGSGGGGGSNNGGGGGNTGRTTVYVTDGPREDYSAVFLTIYQVVAVKADLTTVTLFNDPDGKVINIKTLRDANGERFAFLSDAELTAGTYTAVRVHVGTTATVVPTGGTVGQNYQIFQRPNDTLDAQNRLVYTFNLNTPRDLRGDDLVIDFDLAQFQIVNNQLRIMIREGSKTGLTNRLRLERNHHSGTVSSLSSTGTGTFQFTLTRGNSDAFTVRTDANTVIYNANNSANPTLDNGKHVRVEGYFDTTLNAFIATEVRILGQGQTARTPEVEGPASNINAQAGTFTVTAVKVEHFVPAQSTITVQTSANTVFRSRRGVIRTQAEFFAALQNGARVEVKGSYSAATNTLTATLVKLEDETDNNGGGGGQNNEAEVRGGITNLSTTNVAFTVSPVTSFEGFVFSGTNVNVVTNGSTEYKSAANQNVTSGVFLNALTATSQVKVEGTYNATTNTITARQIRILPG